AHEPSLGAENVVRFCESPERGRTVQTMRRGVIDDQRAGSEPANVEQVRHVRRPDYHAGIRERICAVRFVDNVDRTLVGEVAAKTLDELFEKLAAAVRVAETE